MATPSSQAIAMPPMELPLTAPDKDGILRPTLQWWNFWRALFTRSAATIPYTVETGVAAAGTVQADATPLSAEWNEITTVPANSGVLLDELGIGFDSRVWNVSATPLKVYPPVGFSIDAGAVNAPYTLAAGKAQVFSQLSATEFRSLQLG